MQRKALIGLLAGAAFALGSWAARAQEELTIFWAEWDPANYLQELVNDIPETPRSPSQTTPWPDFQTKAFAEFNARATPTTWSSATRSGSAPARRSGHYVDLTDFFKKHKLNDVMAPATVKYYAEYPKGSRQVLGDPARGRRHRLGLSQGLVRGPEGEGSLQGEVRLRPRRAEDLQGAARHRRVLLSSRPEAVRHRHLHRQFL